VFAGIELALLSNPTSSVGKTTDGQRMVVATVSGSANKGTSAQQEFTSAMAAFNSGKFGDAALRFEKLQTSGFAPDSVHYYLALSYQNCNQVGLAQMHYRWVAAHTKNATLRKYSQSGYGILACYSLHRTFDGQGDNQKATESADATSNSNCNPNSNVRTGPDGMPILKWGYDGLPG
jgi:hypothetical protein